MDSKPLNIVTPFNDQEITIAKTCILNNMSRPPNYYDFYDNNDNKSLLSNQVSSKQVSQFEKALDTAKKDLSDFSMLPHIKEPLDRGRFGNWATDDEFLNIFDEIHIYHNT